MSVYNLPLAAMNSALANSGYGTSALPSVSDPDKAYADLLQQQYQYFQDNFAPLERQLIDRAMSDTSLIDRAREDARQNRTLTAGVMDRAASRYGADLTPAERRERDKAIARGSNLAEVGNVNNARIAQRQLNMSLLSNLANIGNKVYGDATNMLGTAAQLQAARDQAYSNAKANYKSSIWSIL